MHPWCHKMIYPDTAVPHPAGTKRMRTYH